MSLTEFLLKRKEDNQSKFKDVVTAIIDKIKYDVTTDCYEFNTDYYTNYCYESDNDVLEHLLPFEKKNHPIYIRYFNYNPDKTVTSFFIDDIDKIVEDDSSVIILINLGNYNPDKIMNSLFYEFSNLSQLYSYNNYKSIVHSDYIRNKQDEKIMSVIISMFKDKPIDINVLYNCIQSLADNYINNYDFYVVLMIAYYLLEQKLIKTTITDKDIIKMSQMKDLHQRLVYLKDNKKVLKKYADVSELITKKITNKFEEIIKEKSI